MAETKKSRTKRCAICKTSLAILAYSCKCEKQFCINHLPAVEHACSFNYRDSSQTQLSRQLDVSGLTQKIMKI